MNKKNCLILGPLLRRDKVSEATAFSAMHWWCHPQLSWDAPKELALFADRDWFKDGLIKRMCAGTAATPAEMRLLSFLARNADYDG